jgi:hypothetical protein
MNKIIPKWSNIAQLVNNRETQREAKKKVELELAVNSYLIEESTQEREKSDEKITEENERALEERLRKEIEKE